MYKGVACCQGQSWVIDYTVSECFASSFRLGLALSAILSLSCLLGFGRSVRAKEREPKGPYRRHINGWKRGKRHPCRACHAHFRLLSFTTRVRPVFLSLTCLASSNSWYTKPPVKSTRPTICADLGRIMRSPQSRPTPFRPRTRNAAEGSCRSMERRSSISSGHCSGHSSRSAPSTSSASGNRGPRCTGFSA